MTNQPTSLLQTDLGGKVAIVTGAGRGIGRTIAAALAAAGAKLACIDVDPDSLAQTQTAIRDAGGTAEVFIADVTNSTQVNEVVGQVIQGLGRLDILVNNAGITRDTLCMRMKDEQFDAVIAVNLRGTFLFTRAVTRPMMKARRGRIINIASVSGLMGNPGQTNYSASKAGVIGLTRTVAMELAPRNITVNAVAPGFIATEMAMALGDELIEEIKKQTPLGRLGTPEEVANAVLFLASEAAGFITGHVLTVDGGITV